MNELKAVQEQIKRWKAAKQKVVFTNGVFDILHLGHVTYLEAAKAQGDKLVLGLNSDESVRRLNKGPERPINPEHARKGVLMALKAIDAVVVFGDDTPLELIKALEPDVLVKGGDYDPNETDPSKKTFMVGSTEVRASGGEVIAIPLVDGFSTTNIVRRMRD